MIKYLQGFGSYGFNNDFSFRNVITEIARKSPFSLPNLGGFFYQQRHRKEIVCGTHSAKELLRASYGYERPHSHRPVVEKPHASYVTRDGVVHDLRDLDWLETLRLVHDYERDAAHAHMPVNLFPPPASDKLFWQAAGHQLSLRDFVSDIPLERKIMEASEDVCRRLARQSHRAGKWLTMGEVMGEAITTANWYRNHLPMFQLRPYQQPLVDYFAGKK